MTPSARSASSSTSLWAISTSPDTSWQAQAPQMPSRQEYGGSSSASISTSSIRVPAAQGSDRVAPSSVTSSVASNPPSTGAGDSNGLSCRDRNRSTRTPRGGTPTEAAASLTTVRYGSGPQAKIWYPAKGRSSGSRFLAVGVPWTESSQCTTSSRDPAEAASSRSSAAKMIESSSRFAYTSTIRPRPAASADFRIDITGVMPLPAASSRKSPSRLAGVNVPAGGSTSSTMPGFTLSPIQCEAYPSGIRLT